MKKWFFIGAFFMLTLIGCDQTTSRPRTHLQPQLEAIDTLMQTRPDSALTLLLDAPMDDPYYQLLLSEALYKNDSTQANRSELLEAMAYFDSVDDAFLAARCHYMNGVGYYEMDSVVPACEQYLKALKIMEDHFEEKELVGYKAKFKALIFTRLTDVFSDHYLHEQAIFFARLTLPYYQFQGESQSWNYSCMLDEIAIHYHMMERFDSACYYYNKALENLPDTNSLTFRDIATAQAYLSYIKGDSAKTSLKQLEALCSQSENANEYFSRCAIIGDVLYRERLYDSAWVYLDSVFCLSSNVSLKKQSAELLSEICKILGKDDELIKYSSFLVPFANQEENNSEIKSELTELYNTYRQTSLEQKHRWETKRSVFRYGILLVVLLMMIMAITILYHKSKRREDRLEKQISTERSAHQMQQAALSGRLRHSNQKVRDLTARIQQKDHKSAHRVKHDDCFIFEDEPICLTILNRVCKGGFKAQTNCTLYKSYALDRSQLEELRNAADRHFNSFTSRLKKSYPQLTDADLNYCCLYLLGLTTADLSALMQRAYNTVNEREKKLKGLFCTDGSLVLFLKAFASIQTTI